VKSLEANYDAVDGISGATILGNGRVALILDVARLREVGDKPGARTNVPSHNTMVEVREDMNNAA